MTRRLVVAALALLAGSASSGAVSEGRKPVTWVNKDIVAHTATTPAAAKIPFDSQLIGVDREWKHTFTKAGKYDYVCTYHPTMKAVIQVTGQGTAARAGGR